MVWTGPTGSGLDPMYRAALRTSHEVYTRLDVHDHTGALLESGVPLLDGSVTGTLASRVSRTADLVVPRELFPTTASGALDGGGLLAPVGNRVRVWRGVRFATGSTVYFPAIYGRIDRVSRRPSGETAVLASDVSVEVAESQFETPESSVSTSGLAAEFQRLILQADPAASFGASSVGAARVPALTWTDSRSAAADDLAKAIPGIWWTLADGAYVLRPAPWWDPDLPPSGVDYAGGVPTAAANVILAAEVYADRRGVPNAVVASAERATGDAPAYAVARDTDPASPTVWDGPYGRKATRVQVQSARGPGQVLSIAQAQLAAAKGVLLAWSGVEIVPDASVELGDRGTWSYDGMVGDQVIVGYRLPLRESASMSITLASYRPVA